MVVAGVYTDAVSRSKSSQAALSSTQAPEESMLTLAGLSFTTSAPVRPPKTAKAQKSAAATTAVIDTIFTIPYFLSLPSIAHPRKFNVNW